MKNMDQDDYPQDYSANYYGNIQIINNPKDSTITQDNSHQSTNQNESLRKLIEDIKKKIPSEPGIKETVQDKLSVIEKEMANPVPKRTSLLNNALNVLKSIKGGAEFGAAVGALVQFFRTFLP